MSDEYSEGGSIQEGKMLLLQSGQLVVEGTGVSRAAPTRAVSATFLRLDLLENDNDFRKPDGLGRHGK